MSVRWTGILRAAALLLPTAFVAMAGAGPSLGAAWKAAAAGGLFYVLGGAAALRAGRTVREDKRIVLLGRSRLLIAAGEGISLGLFLRAAAAWSWAFPAAAASAACAAALLALRGEVPGGASLKRSLALGGAAFASGAAAGAPWLAAAVLPAAALAGHRIALRFDGAYKRLEVEYRRDPMAVEARNQMLATLAHEIRTPLTIMQSAEGVLLEGMPGPLNERQRKFLESIHANTQRLINFSENMLAVIKMDRGWAPDLSKSVDLRRVTRQVMEMMQPLTEQRRQQIRASFPSMLAKPRGDEAWIRLVLVNMVHNAYKHAEDGGLILVSVTQDDEWVVLTVSDNGEGLAGTGRDILFKEFYQERPDSETGREGFGLGLAIVRYVVDRHGGRVYVTGSPALGTMISFTLPIRGAS